MRRLAAGLLCVLWGVVGCGFDPPVEDGNAVVPEVRFAFATSITDETVGNATVFVELSEPTTVEVKVGIGVVEGGTASADADFDLQIGEIAFAPGVTSVEVPVEIVPDTVVENDENVLLELRSPDGATLGPTRTHDLRISANILPKISFATGTAMVLENVNTQQFPVQLSNASATDVLFAYSVGGTSTLGKDHSLASGMMTLPAGQTTISINAPILDDPTDEENETLVIGLTALSGAVVGQNRTRQHLILDDDNAPILGFTAATGTTNETGNATITVTIAVASAKTVSASYSVASGSAGAADFTATSGTLTFAPGVISQQFTVAITEDALYENNETFTISLTNLANATAGQLTHDLTITDNDTIPELEFQSTSDTVDEDLVTTQNVRVTLSAASGLDTSFSLNVTGSATRGVNPGDDYDVSNGPFTIPAGQTSVDIPVTIRSNSPGSEDPETAILQLTAQTNATLGNQGTHTLTIIE
ncbi:MAG TPA: Calx-beta domain-containing protein [Kofleriaceae bacterium]